MLGATPIERATREAEHRAGGCERFDEIAGLPPGPFSNRTVVI